MKRSRIETDPDKVRAWQDRSRKPLPRQSAKRRREAIPRAEVSVQARERDGGCVGRGLIPDHECSGALDPHERIPRTAWPGGHLVLDNVVTVCRAAHEWIHANEIVAHGLGLHGYSWERPAGS